MTDDLTCRDLCELLTALIEGSLDSDTEGGIRRHLAICAGCQQYLDQLEQTIALVRSSSLDEPVEIPTDLLRDLATAFGASRRST